MKILMILAIGCSLLFLGGCATTAQQMSEKKMNKTLNMMNTAKAAMHAGDEAEMCKSKYDSGYMREMCNTTAALAYLTHKSAQFALKDDVGEKGFKFVSEKTNESFSGNVNVDIPQSGNYSIKEQKEETPVRDFVGDVLRIGIYTTVGGL
jgi:hypothetical protein